MRTAYRHLYGDPEGNWMIVRLPGSTVPPTRVGCLAYLGTTSGAVAKAYQSLRDLGVSDAQDRLGRLLRRSQRAISTYLVGTSDPELDDDGTAELVRLLMLDAHTYERAREVSAGG